MFVTSQPGRVVGAQTLSVNAGTVQVLGKEGLYGRLRLGAEGFILSPETSTSPSDGYQAAEGETVEFSGKITVYNGAASAGTVSVLLFDTL